MRKFWCMLMFVGLGWACAQRPAEQWLVLYNEGELAAYPSLQWHFRDAAGNSYHAGTLMTEGNLPLAITLLSYDSQGGLRWFRNWYVDTTPESVQLQAEGGLAVFTRRAALYYTMQGALERAERLEGTPSDGIRTLIAAAIDASGHRYLLYGSSSFATNAVVNCVGAAGELLWSYTLPGQYAYDLYLDSGGGIVVVTGVPVEGVPVPRTHFLRLTRLNRRGSLLWQTQANRYSFELHRVLGETPLGQLVITDGVSVWLAWREIGALTLVNGWLPSNARSSSGMSATMLPGGRFALGIGYAEFPSLLTFRSAVAVYEPTGSLRWTAEALGVLTTTGLNNPGIALSSAPGSDSLWLLTPDRAAQPPVYRVVRFDGSGTTLWARSHAVPESASITTIGLLAYPNGESLSLWREGAALRTVRYDGAGNLRYNQSHTFASPTRDWGRIVPDGMGGVYAQIGQRLQRYDAQGNRLWDTLAPVDAFVSNGAGDLFTLRHSSNQVTVTRRAPSGAVVWQQSYSMSGLSSTTPLLLAGDGALYVLGYQRTAAGVNQPSILKIGFDGALRWEQTDTGVSDPLAFAGIASPDGGLYTLVPITSPLGQRMVRYDADGNLAWVATLANAGIVTLAGVDSASNITLAASEPVGTTTQTRLLRYRPDGALLWQHTLPEAPRHLGVAPSGAFYLTTSGTEGHALLAFSETGALRWRRSLPTPDNFFWEVVLDAAGNAWVHATRRPIPRSLEDRITMICYDAGGEQAWMLEFAGPLGLGNTLLSLLPAPDGRTLTLSGTTVTESGGYDAFLARYQLPRPGDVNRDGCVDDADLLSILFNFGDSNSETDLNGDGIVDDADLLRVLFHFGDGC